MSAQISYYRACVCTLCARGQSIVREHRDKNQTQTKKNKKNSGKNVYIVRRLKIQPGGKNDTTSLPAQSVFPDRGISKF